MTTMTMTTATITGPTMTTKRRVAFDKSAATLSLLAVVAGLGIGAAARSYTAPAVTSPAALEPMAQGAAVPTIVVVRRLAPQPLARTRAS